MVSKFAGPGSLRSALRVAAGPGAQDRKQELSATTCSSPASCPTTAAHSPLHSQPLLATPQTRLIASKNC